MTFKPKQLDPEAIKVFSETEVGTLLENIDDKLGLILEGQDGMKNNIRTIKNSHKQLEEGVSKTEIRLDTMEVR